MVEIDEGCCCGCCCGLAIGYMLFSNHADASNPYEHNYQSETQGLIEVIESTQPDNFLLRQINNYQTTISPKIKERLGKDSLCKFEPSCSEYAKQAIETYGSLKGSLMAVSRLLRCNPLNSGGYDPIK